MIRVVCGAVPRRRSPKVSLTHVWWVIPILLCYAMLSLAPLREGDLWWHLRLGEAIATTRNLPTVDQWTVAGADRPFNAAHSWLGDLTLYGLEAKGGLAALVMLQAMTGTLTVALLQCLCSILRADARGAAMLSIVSFLSLFPFSTARPQIFSWLLFACFEVILIVTASGRLRWLVMLPVLMIVWVNLHGAWVMGLGLFGIYGLWWVWTGLSGQRSLHSLWPHALTGLGVLLATFLNPEGIGSYAYLLVMGRSPISQKLVSEWQPPSLGQSFTWPFWGLLLVSGVLLLTNRTRRIDAPMLAAACFVVLALRFMRMIPFAVITLVPVLAPRVPKRSEMTETSGAVNASFMGVLTVLAVLTTPYVRLAAGLPLGSLIDTYFPVAACEALARPEHHGGRVFTLAEWGGYVEWRLWPDVQPFVDGRVELPTVAAWEDYFALSAGRPGWQELVRSYGVTHMLLSRQRQGLLIELARSDGWKSLYEDADVVVLKSPEQGFSPEQMSYESCSPGGHVCSAEFCGRCSVSGFRSGERM